jgi:hypothetical protein
MRAMHGSHLPASASLAAALCAKAAGLLALGIACVIAWPRPVESHGSITTTVLFDREIVRILNERCVMCHVDGGLSFPLVSYEQTWLQGRAMQASVLRRHMPPWSAVAGYGEFINDNHLTLRETQFLVSWVEGLGPRNAGKVFLNVVDPRAAPPQEIRAATHSDHWQLGEPDLKIDVGNRESRIGDQGLRITDQGSGIRRTVVDLGLAASRQVRALEFMPADRRHIVAAVFSLESTGQWLGSWTPWHSFVSLPDGATYQLPARSRIVVDVHYRGSNEASVEGGTLGLFFSPPRPSSNREARRVRAKSFGEPRRSRVEAGTPNKPATELMLDAHAERSSRGSDNARASARLARETRVWAIQPEIVPGLSSLEVSARRPDGGTDVLLALTQPSVEWPTPYLLKTPRLLAPGTELRVVARSSTSVSRVRVRIGKY